MYANIELHSPRGKPAIINYREDTSDLSVIGGTWRIWDVIADEYGLGSLPDLTGVAVDIGAHVGSVALALLADHPTLHVIAVDPLAENLAVIAATAEGNGWTDRLTLVCAAIAKGRSATVNYGYDGSDYLRDNRFIGGISASTDATQTVIVPTTTLSKLVPGPIAFLKTDCEGCEWDLLADRAIKRTQRIVGEGHDGGWLDKVHALLDATHDVTVLDDRGGPGTFAAVLR